MNGIIARKVMLVIVEADQHELILLSFLLNINLDGVTGEEARIKMYDTILKRGEKAIESFGITLNSIPAWNTENHKN